MNELQDLVDQIPEPVVTGWIWISSFAVGYAIGAINPASIIARIRGTDLRAVGSGNPGATNAGRAFGWKVGVLVAVLDILKGLLPVLALTYLFGEVAGLIGGIAAVLGHISSPFLRGRGGKGVATSLGVIIGMMPLASLIIFAVWGVVLKVTRYVSLASIIAAASLPVAVIGLMFFGPAQGWGAVHGWGNFYFAVAAAALVIRRHVPNIQRLRAGTELRVGTPKPVPQPSPTHGPN